ncbi:U3 small nucleolar RNA-associated protein 4 homolog [Heterodontus francisci]|uniref:U3 small nucleolar RNA-associated protein 4 homolog n=1 Tax=Heterodontus francisci TaxID=7792 RepID=UPI00355BFDEE
MGEFLVHRVRFFDFVPSGIRAVAYSGRRERLALARGDGSLEIFNFADNFLQEKVIPGNDKRSIEAISWVGADRLLSVGLNGEIIEFDLQRLCPKYRLDAFGGPLWCMSCNFEETHLAVGCEDGSVKLFEIVPEKLQFERNLDRQKGRVLSLAWHKSGAMIATGSLDVIRVFDVKSGHCTRRILVDRGDTALHNRECVVWSLGFLSDYTIVSADSAGKVQFWDWQTGTLLKTHPVTKCDVLTLAVNEAEDSITAGTSEGTVIQFQLLAVKTGVADTQWVRTKTFKHHSHDVRAVIHTKSALVSGGLDAQLVIRPLMDRVETKSYEAALRKVLFPHRNLVCCSRKANLLLFQFPEQLELWRLGSPGALGIPGDVLPISKKPEKLLQLRNKGCDHIRCSALSPCGTWIAFSNIYRVRLYRIQYENDSVTVNAASRFVKTLQPAHRLLFSADSSKLFVASDHSRVQVVDLKTLSSKRAHILTPKSDSLEPVCLLAASADGNWLAAVNYGCEISIYNLKQLKYHCTVPVYNHLPTAIAINPQTNNLITVHADHQIFEFSISEKKYTEWSRELQQQGLHPLWVERDTPVTHVTFNPKVPTQIILHDTYMFCIIDQLLRLPTESSMLNNQVALKVLSANVRKAQEHAFKICKKFKPLLHVELLLDGCLVVVERPVMDINAQLPAPVRQKKFAT